MGEASRAELLEEIQSLREQLQQQDRQLLRLKRTAEVPPRPRISRKIPEIPGTIPAPVGMWLSDLLAASLARLGRKTGLVGLDEKGRIRSAWGAVGTAIKDSAGTNTWEDILDPEARIAWRNYFRNLNQNMAARKSSATLVSWSQLTIL